MVLASTSLPLLLLFTILVLNSEVRTLSVYQSSRNKGLKSGAYSPEGLELRTLAEICSIRECDRLLGTEWAECVLSCHESSDLGDLESEEDDVKKEQDEGSPRMISNDDDDDDQDNSATIAPLRRQVDPLQSCIETRCAGRRGSHYTHCILKKCLLELGLGSRFDGRTRSLPVVDNDKLSTTEALKNEFKKRGVNDITDVCIEYYCPRETPGTLGYLTCVASYRCRGR